MEAVIEVIAILGLVRCVNVPPLAGDTLTSLADHASVVFPIFMVAI